MTTPAPTTPALTTPVLTTPDVTVVIAVYNTMPYLTKCLDSLIEQTIGLDRLEIVAVDDGSTDGGTDELDRYATAYPSTVRVIHQPNSGGPAQPSNRGLEAARGRYVFFLGADDYLGSEALARLVNAADAWHSDVVLGRMVGVNGRYAHQAIFDGNRESISLYDSSLPYHLSNTKLFRRALLENHKIRYPEDMPVGSDQPFTLEACVHAERISVLADYPFYYAVKRRNSKNMTYQSGHEKKLRYTTDVLAFIARLIEPGTGRDAVILRHFDWELAKLVQDDFQLLDRDTQERVRAGIATLVQTYLTDGLRDRLTAESRVRLEVARFGTVEDLVAVIRQDAQVGVPATVRDGDRVYAGYPGFRDARSLPDQAFDVTSVAGGWFAKLDATAARTSSAGRILEITMRSPAADLSGHFISPIAFRAGVVPATSTSMSKDDRSTVIQARFVVGDLAHVKSKRPRHVWTLGGTLGSANDVPVRAPTLGGHGRILGRHGFQVYSIKLVANEKGQLTVSAVPLTAHRVAASLRRAWRKGRRK